VFHRECLREWIQIHPSCPMCRKELNLSNLYPSFLPIITNNPIIIPPLYVIPPIPLFSFEILGRHRPIRQVHYNSGDDDDDDNNNYHNDELKNTENDDMDD